MTNYEKSNRKDQRADLQRTWRLMGGEPGPERTRLKRRRRARR